MNRQALRVALLLFGSGFCALVYQTAWLREFRLIFGASTAASAAVLAIFMGGLGAGSWLLGKRADRAKRPLELYGNLELFIALTAMVTPFALQGVRALYIWTGGSEALGATGATAVRLILSALVLAAPTLAMGGTLPAAIRAIESPEDTTRRSVAIVYAANTLGAVLGTALTTFVVFEIFGVRNTLWMAALLNVIVALIARVSARTMPVPSAAAPAVEVAGPVEPPPGHVPMRFVLLAAATTGFVFFLLELAWYRMLSPILGGSTFTFGLILALALAAIGAGGALYGARRRTEATLQHFALVSAIEAVMILVPLALGDRLAVLAAILRNLTLFGFSGLVLGWTVIASIVVVPAALVSGYQFPLMIALLGRGSEKVGAHVGWAYAANTFGSIAGSLTGGFWLIPLLGAPLAWKLSAVALAVLAVASMVLAVRGGWNLRSAAGPVAALSALVLLSFAEGPTAVWRHSPIGAGRSPVSRMSPSQFEGWKRSVHRSIAWEEEGLESGIALNHTNGYAFIVNGKSDGHTLADAATQIMGGVIGALHHPSPKKALVIGLGTGSSAGWLAAIPGMERVDAVEIEPAILRVAEASGPVNAGVIHNPKVRVVLGDAREWLLVTRDRYDVVFSEPSNPYRAGIASLYTQEFYRAAADRLTDDGVFVQWLQAYEISPVAFRSALATLRSVFADVQIWRGQSSDALLVARSRRAPLPVDRLRERVSTPGYREALGYGWRVDDVEGVLAYFVADDGVARSILEQDPELISTDDLNVLEFSFARSVGVAGGVNLTSVAESARTVAADAPPVEGTFDQVRYTTRKALHGARHDTASPSAKFPDRDIRRGAFLLAMVRGDLERARLVDPADLEVPLDPEELVYHAERAAMVGDPRLAEWTQKLQAAGNEAVVYFVNAQRHARAQDAPAAAAELKAGFVRARTEAFIPRPLLLRALNVALWVGRKDPAGGRELLEVLGHPFAVESLREQRLVARVELADTLGFTPQCVDIFAPLEPWTPWDRWFLKVRGKCYLAAQSPLVERAVKDLMQFESWQPLPVLTGHTDGEPAPVMPDATADDSRSAEQPGRP